MRTDLSTVVRQMSNTLEIAIGSRLKMNPIKLLIVLCVTLAASSAVSVTSANAAKQCIKNNSGTILDVTWYNKHAKVDKQATNHNLTYGFQACQDNPELGFAEIKCKGCQWATPAAKTAIIAGVGAAWGTCIYVSAGNCALLITPVLLGTYSAVSYVPKSFHGKFIVVPAKGKTIRITGNAFELNVKE